ncbi:MAG: hypothetical protein JWM90_2592 [Thermoleophilia bacterium]|nr:hypothetical protein [Thermoleophilia bacterium]
MNGIVAFTVGQSRGHLATAMSSLQSVTSGTVDDVAHLLRMTASDLRHVGGEIHALPHNTPMRDFGTANAIYTRLDDTAKLLTSTADDLPGTAKELSTVIDAASAGIRASEHRLGVIAGKPLGLAQARELVDGASAQASAAVDLGGGHAMEASRLLRASASDLELASSTISTLPHNAALQDAGVAYGVVNRLEDAAASFRTAAGELPESSTGRFNAIGGGRDNVGAARHDLGVLEHGLFGPQ